MKFKFRYRADVEIEVEESDYVKALKSAEFRVNHDYGILDWELVSDEVVEEKQEGVTE